MKAQLVVLALGLAGCSFAHAVEKNCTDKNVGQLFADRVVKVGDVTTYFNPGLCMGEGLTAVAVYEQDSDATGVCKAFGQKSGVIGSGDWDAGHYSANFDENGQLYSIGTTCGNSTDCARIIKTISCR